MQNARLKASIVGASLLLLFVLPRPLAAQECPFEANEYTNEAASQIQSARGAASEAERAPFYERALQQLAIAIAENPNDVAALWLYGEVYIDQGDYAAADSMLDRLVEVAPGCQARAAQTRRAGWVTAYNEGIQAFNAGDLTSAQGAFEKANLIDQDALSYNNLAYIYQQQGETEKAIDTYRIAREVATEPDLLRAATINLAELLTMNERADEAREIYAEYTASHPDDALARINYAVLLMQAGERDRATELFAELMEREDNTFEEWNELGIGLLRVYAFEEAIPVFTRARELEPFNKNVMVNLVDAQIETDLYAEAMPLADTLVKWYPYDGSQYSPLARCLSRTGKPGDALMYLQLQEGLPFEFLGVQMTSGSGNQYVVRGDVVGRGGSVGETITVPFEFLGRDGDVVVSEGLDLVIPPAGVNRAIRLEVESETPIAGFRYSRVGS